MRTVDARRDHDDHALVARLAELDDVKPENRRADRCHGRTAQTPLVVLAQLAGVLAPNGYLLTLGDAEDQSAPTAVGHRGNVLGEVRVRDCAEGRKLGLPVQVFPLTEPL